MEKQCGNFKTMIMYHDSIADKFFQTQTFLAKNITQNRKRFIANSEPKHILIKVKMTFLKPYWLLF